MEQKKRAEMVGQCARNYFEDGHHCAESTVRALLEGLGEDPSHALAHSTAFSGGFARSHEEACGALCGAMIAIGHMHPRKAPGEPFNEALELGTQIRERFLELYGTTKCQAIRAQFDQDNPRLGCAKLVERITSDMSEMLQAAKK